MIALLATRLVIGSAPDSNEILRIGGERPIACVRGRAGVVDIVQAFATHGEPVWFGRGGFCEVGAAGGKGYLPAVIINNQSPGAGVGNWAALALTTATAGLCSPLRGLIQEMTGDGGSASRRNLRVRSSGT